MTDREEAFVIKLTATIDRAREVLAELHELVDADRCEDHGEVICIACARWGTCRAITATTRTGACSTSGGRADDPDDRRHCSNIGAACDPGRHCYRLRRSSEGPCNPAGVPVGLAWVHEVVRRAGIGAASGRSRDRRPVPVRPIDVRDRALVLLMYSAALRRSELVALDVGDVTETDDGLVVLLRRGKTDQEGVGATVGVPYGSDPATCPVRALRRHLDESVITDGPIFRREEGCGADPDWLPLGLRI